MRDCDRARTGGETPPARRAALFLVAVASLIALPTVAVGQSPDAAPGVRDAGPTVSETTDAREDTPPASGGEAPGTASDAHDATDESAAPTPSSGEDGRTGPGESNSPEDSSRSLDDIKGSEGQSTWNRLASIFGLFVLVFVAWLLSERRWQVDWRLVGMGVGLQIAFGLLIFEAPIVASIFDYAGAAVAKLLEFSDAGSEFLFDFANPTDGEWARSAQNFAFSILPTIIFFSTLMTVLYYLGVMQVVVRWFAKLMRKTMNISGAESLSASANIFVGQTEAPLVIKPYVEDMTQSELAVVMTGGFATVAGGVLAAYVGMLQQDFPGIAKHLLTASVMSAPAALVIAKVMFPEVDSPETLGEVEVEFESQDVNVVDAAARGASEGLELALNVGAMLLAFLAVVAMLNYIIGWPGMQWNLFSLEELIAHYRDRGIALPEATLDDETITCTMEAVGTEAEKIHACVAQLSAGASTPDPWLAPVLSLEKILGYVFWPFAFVMGVPVTDCFYIGRLMGEKMVLNEFVAYASLSALLNNPDIELQRRSAIIATYALCGFANFGSIGIQLGGIGGIAPSRKHDLARIALKAMIGGTLAAMMTATVAGILV